MDPWDLGANVPEAPWYCLVLLQAASRVEARDQDLRANTPEAVYSCSMLPRAARDGRSGL
eukprot:3233647-Alexandrium_andersonii.AAC.1